MQLTRNTIKGSLPAFLIVALLLATVILAPYGPDNGLFHLAGERIVHDGATHYDDIVDLKSPPIYYLYASVVSVFDAPIAVRLADYVLQLIVAFLLFRLVVDRTGRRQAGAYAAVFYAVLYGGQSFLNYTQTGSFLAPLSVALLFLLTKQSTTSRDWILAGVICGVAFLLKFTFIALLVVPAVLAVRKHRRASPKPLLLTVVGALAGPVLLLLYLLATDTMQDFAWMLEFTRGYAATDTSGVIGTISSRSVGLLRWMVLYGSPLVTALFIIVGARTLFEATDTSGQSTRDGTTLLLLSLVAIGAHFIAIGIEGNFAGWYFIRLFPFLAIVSGIGADRALAHNRIRRLPRSARLAIIGLAVAVSPLPRHLYHAAGSISYHRNGYEALDRYYDYGDGEGRLHHLNRAGEIAADCLEDPDDELFVVSGSASLVYLAADRRPRHPVFHSGFIIAPFAPNVWREAVHDSVLADPPEVQVLDHDVMTTVTGVDVSSAEAYRHIPGIDSLLSTHYRRVFEDMGVELWVYNKTPVQSTAD